MGIEGTEAGVQFLDLVGLAIAVGITNPKDIGGLGNDDAVLVENQGGGEFQAIGKDGLFVHDSIAVGIFQHGDTIIRAAFFLTTNGEMFGVTGTPGGNFGVISIDIAATGILGSLDNPHTTLGVPIHRHDFLGDVFIGGEGDVEFGMKVDVLDGFARRGWAAFGITERGQFFRRAKLVHIGTLPCPGDAAQKDGPIMRGQE